MQALIDTYFTLSSVIWSGIVALTLYLVIVLHKQNVESHEKYYHLVSWGLPAICSGLPFITDSYESYDESSSYWCWIKSDEKLINIIWQGVLLYIPLWSVVLFNIFCYIRIIQALNSQIDFISTDDNYKTQLMRRLKLYPAVLLVCYLPTSLFRLGQYINWQNNENMVLPTIALAMSTLVGFSNAIIYGLNPSVQQCIGEWCRSRRTRVSTYESIESSSVSIIR